MSPIVAFLSVLYICVGVRVTWEHKFKRRASYTFATMAFLAVLLFWPLFLIFNYLAKKEREKLWGKDDF